MKKFGGVKITLQKVSAPQPRGAINLRTPGNCPCGKSCADCDDEWDRKLGITGRSADQYSENLAKVRRAQLEGHDAYHTKLRREADGETVSWGWTPHMPPGTIRVPTTEKPAVATDLNIGGQHGPKQGGGGNGIQSRSRSGSSQTTTRGGRRGKRKSIRRKR